MASAPPARRTPALMLQGTGSDVGKSLLTAGLARLFTRRGLTVRPFKPQNMSNNAAVTVEGGEIGRAQALQARAAGITPSVHMNPVLLKPQSERGAQVVVQGRMIGASSARDYQRLRRELLPRVIESFTIVASGADLVLVEGAGSTAEVNLRDGDIANMGFAEAADLPVVLIGDIERGGVLAQIVGTHLLLSEAERARLKGVIVNKFRGDVALFQGGIETIKRMTGLDCLGVVSYFARAHELPAEDALALDRIEPPQRAGKLRIVVPRLPRIANFDDLDPLRAERDVAVYLAPPGRPLPLADLILLPGSKATLADLAALRAEGWDIDISAHRRRGGAVLGLCAGYQILGRRVADPGGIEGPPGAAPGLGLLDVETVLTADKMLTTVEGIDVKTGAAIKGYEMHVGRSTGPDTARPMLRLGDRLDGAMSRDGRVMGCHVHGLFSCDPFRRAFIAALGGKADQGLIYEAQVDSALDALADHLDAHLDVPALLEIARAR
ncbi:MAG TPA: cobyric acid synthase [Stellaceae bacterium]|nr:cobyric acid synthase [Stellaceae bacterium]